MTSKADMMEIEMKEVKEELKRLTASIAKSEQKGWLVERATHRKKLSRYFH